jgi:hypothetical protein
MGPGGFGWPGGQRSPDGPVGSSDSGGIPSDGEPGLDPRKGIVVEPKDG